MIIDTWDLVQPKYADIIEWWHDRGKPYFRRANRFAAISWRILSNSSPTAIPSTINISNLDDDVKFWIYTLALIWRGFILDFGANYPLDEEDWGAIGEWIDLDFYKYFSTDDYVECYERVSEEFRRRFQFLLKELVNHELMIYSAAKPILNESHLIIC
jgi:hypothetical protein